MVSVKRDPISELEVSTKRYVDTRWVVGDLKYSIRATDHIGWLKCDGRSLSRTNYADLFNVIGTTYGADDSYTFKLPDCRGRVLGAIGTGSGLTARSAGTLIGSETHTLTVSELPSHTHSITDPGHTHTVANTVGITGQDTPSGLDASPNEFDLNTSFTTTSSSSTTGITVNATGGGGAHNNMQPTAFVGNVYVFGGLV